MSVGIGATNDGCNRDNRSIIVETVFRYKTIKAAAFTHMRKLDSRYVVGDGPASTITAIAAAVKSGESGIEPA